MGTADTNGKNKRPVKPGLKQALEGMLERLREELDRLIPPPQRIPVPVPIPVPSRRIRR